MCNCCVVWSTERLVLCERPQGRYFGDHVARDMVDTFVGQFAQQVSTLGHNLADYYGFKYQLVDIIRQTITPMLFEGGYFCAPTCPNTRSYTVDLNAFARAARHGMWGGCLVCLVVLLLCSGICGGHARCCARHCEAHRVLAVRCRRTLHLGKPSRLGPCCITSQCVVHVCARAWLWNDTAVVLCASAWYFGFSTLRLNLIRLACPSHPLTVLCVGDEAVRSTIQCEDKSRIFIWNLTGAALVFHCNPGVGPSTFSGVIARAVAGLVTACHWIYIMGR